MASVTTFVFVAVKMEEVAEVVVEEQVTQDKLGDIVNRSLQVFYHRCVMYCHFPLGVVSYHGLCICGLCLGLCRSYPFGHDLCAFAAEMFVVCLLCIVEAKHQSLTPCQMKKL